MNEDLKSANNKLRCELTDSFWQQILIGWNAFPTCEKVVSRLWLDEKIAYEFFMRSIQSENLSKYEIMAHYSFIYW